MGTTCLTSSSCSSYFVCKTTTSTTRILEPCLSSIHFRYPKLFPSLSQSNSSEPFVSSSSSSSKTRISSIFALVDEEPLAATMSTGDTNVGEESSVSKSLLRHCELYVCNLPRSCDISELLDLFKPHGTVHSVEISRNAETGTSRGCGYVTMGSLDEAKVAIAALDGSDVGGREMRVRFSVDMKAKRRYLESLHFSKPQKNLIFESPYKVYVGNLPWSVKPEDLKKLFSQFGTVNSSRVLHDRKGGKNRVYGFLSFSSPAESEAALSLNKTEFSGRTILVREAQKKAEP